MPKLNVNPNNNSWKQDDIVKLWYQFTGENFAKVNLATNEQVKNAVPAGKEEYNALVANKQIPLVNERPIKVSKTQNLHIVSYSNTHYYDLANFQKGITNKTHYEGIRQDLKDKFPGDKTVVFFGGNMIGKEWIISVLNTASLTDINHGKDDKLKILFWGLNQRMDLLIKDLIYAANNGADEIILMNGREEHYAKTKLNKDVFNEMLTDKFNKILFEYAVKKANERASKKVSISYVPGTKKVFNIEKNMGNGKYNYYDISMHTNLKTNSSEMGANYSAAVKQHAGLASADYVFVQSENVAGIPDDDGHVVFLNGQSTYMSSAKGDIPRFAPKGRSSITLFLGDKSHDVEHAWTAQIVNEKTYALEKKNAILSEQFRLMQNAIQQKSNEMANEFADRSVNYKGYVKYIEKDDEEEKKQ